MDEERESLLGKDKRKYTDDKKSMAIINLQAILDSDDIDLIIKLLESNNWDETRAANAYY